MNNRPEDINIKNPDTGKVTAQQRGETMAYALQNAVFGLGANFFEPYVNYRVQKRYAEHGHQGEYGNYTQNLAGEFAGDIIGASSLILLEALFPERLHASTRTVRKWVDPFYNTAAHIALAQEKNAPDYDEQVEKWKTYQERNLVRSLIIASGGIAGNVATQKFLIRNPAPGKTIFAGKLLSTALTTSLGLATRMVFPKSMKGMDRWLGANIFTPMLQDKNLAAPDR